MILSTLARYCEFLSISSNEKLQGKLSSLFYVVKLGYQIKSIPSAAFILQGEEKM
jgi:hypothetical protein